MSLLFIRINNFVRQNKYLTKGLIKNYLLFFALFLSVFFLLNYILSVSANNSEETIRINASADSWVESYFPDNNHGSDTNLYVKNTSSVNKTQAFLRFDLSGIPPASITSATLNLYSTPCSSTFLVFLSVYFVENDSWDEYAITWNNKPEIGQLINTSTVGKNKWARWNVTDAVIAEYSGDKNLSLVLSFPASHTYHNKCFYSREYSDTNYTPYLNVSYILLPTTTTSTTTTSTTTTVETTTTIPETTTTTSTTIPTTTTTTIETTTTTVETTTTTSTTTSTTTTTTSTTTTTTIPTIPSVENPTTQNTTFCNNVTITVQAWDPDGIDTVILYDTQTFGKYDFGIPTSPVEVGFTNVTNYTLYTPSQGYGWNTAPLDGRDRVSGTALTRDLIFDNVDREFRVDVANGTYDVTVYLGDMSYAHDKMDVIAEGVYLANDADTSAGEIKTFSSKVNVSDGQLNVLFHDDGGTNPHWTSNGLIVERTIPYVMEYVSDNTYAVTFHPSSGKHDLRFVANDTQGYVNDTVTASFYVYSAPSIAYVNITPSSPNTTSILNCTPYGWYDPDGDPERYYYQWYDDGMLIVNATNSTYNCSLPGCDKGDLIICEVTPYDSYQNGTALNGSVVIGNSAPSKPKLSPATGTFHNVVYINCSGSVDPDGDTITYQIQTDVNGTWQNLVVNDSDGYYEWDISNYPCKNDVDLKCRASDGINYSSWRNPAGKINIDNCGPVVILVDPTPADGARTVNNWIFVNAIVFDNQSAVYTCILEWNGTNETMGNSTYDIIVDDGDLGYNDTGWNYAIDQGYGNDVHYIINGTGLQNATWTPNLPAPGEYKVYVSWTTHPNRAKNANYTIYYNGGSHSFTVNQENYANGSTGSSLGEWSGWYYAGKFNFSAGTNGKVILTDKADEYVIADAVKFTIETCGLNKTTEDCGNYTYRVYANDTLGNEGGSEYRNNKENKKPSVPVLLLPVNATFMSNVTVFDWTNSTDDENDSITYDLLVDNDLNFTSPLLAKFGLIDSNYTLNATERALFVEGTYYWKVRAFDGYEYSDYSLPWMFVVDLTPPRVENSTVMNVTECTDLNITVDAWDESSISTVIVEYMFAVKQFDFGTATSPVEAGFINVTKDTVYSTNGYGWVTAVDNDYDRGIGDNLTGDFIYDNDDRIFNINLTNDEYLVTVLLGDKGAYSHDNMNVYAEGTLKLQNINTSAGEVKWLDFTVKVTDGQLNIKFNDSGGTDPNWVCEGLIISKSQKYQMTKIGNNTYRVTIHPCRGIHTIRYYANDTVGNVNNSVTDWFDVTYTTPQVVSVSISPSFIVNDTIYIGTGNIQFNITFNKPMNTSVPLSVTYGNVTPYNDFNVTGSWASSKTWLGSSTINDSVPNGNYTLNISGGMDQSCNSFIGQMMVENTSTWFMIDTNVPRVISVVLNNNVTCVREGNVTFVITFGPNMNTSINPTVTFGISQPYNTYVVNGSWTDNKTWVGYFYITSSMPNRRYTLSISGAQDLLGRTMKTDTSHGFNVDTMPPMIGAIYTSNITKEDNETVAIEVKDYDCSGYVECGLDTVLVELNNSLNYTMKLGYYNSLLGYYVYYYIIPNTSYGIGNQLLRFYANDTAGNMNGNMTATFYVNSMIPKIGGKIAFLCRDTSCNDDIESALISWLKSQGWNVTTDVYYKWKKSTLLNSSDQPIYDLMMCSDERYACDYATRSTTDVSYVHKNKKVPFVEIGDDSSLRAAKNFGYVRYTGGSTENNNSIYVTVSHPITTGYFGSMQIFSTSKAMTSISDMMLSGVRDIADAGNENGKSTLFSKDQPGRFVYVGWFYRGFSNLNTLGNTTLSRAISWAQCGNAKGCS